MQMYALALKTSSSVVKRTIVSLMYAHWRCCDGCSGVEGRSVVVADAKGLLDDEDDDDDLAGGGGDAAAADSGGPGVACGELEFTL